MRIVWNMLGQQADADNPLAAGYYLYDNNEDATTDLGCGELRAGFIELGNGTRIPTCAGNLMTEHLPDMILVDDWFKPFLKYALGLSIILFAVAIYINRKNG